MVASVMHVCIFSDFLVITYSLFNDKKGKKRNNMNVISAWMVLDIEQRSHNVLTISNN